MNKLNRTYVMGFIFLLFAALVAWQSGSISFRLVSNEPGPRFFPYISAAGMAVMAVLSMIYDGPKDKGSVYLDKAGYKRLVTILVVILLFCAAMQYIGFWIASMIFTYVFVHTLANGKKYSKIGTLILAVALGSVCYFGFTRGFFIPLPKGAIWDMLGIVMP